MLTCSKNKLFLYPKMTFFFQAQNYVYTILQRSESSKYKIYKRKRKRNKKDSKENEPFKVLK